MDYEKKYKEALESAKKAIKYPDKPCFARVDEIFPELKESEDEKIRKELIDFVQKFIECHDKPDAQRDEQYESWLAWLKKQGEPIDKEKVLIGARKNVALSIMNYLDKNTLGMCLSNMECKDLEDAIVDSDWSKVYAYMKKKLEKRGEQKPNPYSGTSFEYNGHAWGMCARDNGVDILCDKHIIEHFEMQGEQKSNSYCQENCKGYQQTGKCFADGDCKAKIEAEQKPVWSEEDEWCLENAIMYCEWARDKAPDVPCYETSENTIKWLKSLKNRVQPKQEWSEEDKNFMYDTLSNLTELKDIKDRYGVEYGNVGKCIDWLKSLKERVQPQNTWNPGDEQMKALCFVKKAKILDPEERESLNSLYIQLKKLREKQ